MSTERLHLDQYMTDPDAAEYLVSLLDIGEHDQCIEGHVGDGAFSAALLRRTPRVTVIDLDPNVKGLDTKRYAEVGRTPCAMYGGVDFCTFHANPAEEYPFDWTVGNPPYREAIEHLEYALRISVNVAFLLRQAFLESKKRKPFWQKHPPTHVHMLSDRLSAPEYDGRTDKFAYAFFVWQRHAIMPPGISLHSWRERRRVF